MELLRLWTWGVASSDVDGDEVDGGTSGPVPVEGCAMSEDCSVEAAVSRERERKRIIERAFLLQESSECASLA